MLSRVALIENMSAVAAALSDSDLDPIMGHFWFTGEDLLAYNMVLGISIPCKTDFKGAVPRTLLELLRSSKAKEVDLLDDRDTLTVKAGSSRFKLATLPAKDFNWDMERLAKNLPEVDGQAFVRALKQVMRSVDAKGERPEYRGVTVIQEGSKLLIYACDNSTISYGYCTGEVDNARSILPLEWCKAVIECTEKADDIELEINNKFALLRADDVLVYGLLSEPDGNEQDFVKVVDKLMDAVHKDDWSPIPDKLPEMLDRAAIIMKGAKRVTKTKVSVERGKLRSYTETELGEVEDFCLFEKAPDVEARINPVRVREGLDYEEIAFNTSVVIFRTPGVGAYLVSGKD